MNGREAQVVLPWMAARSCISRGSTRQTLRRRGCAARSCTSYDFTSSYFSSPTDTLARRRRWLPAAPLRSRRQRESGGRPQPDQFLRGEEAAMIGETIVGGTSEVEAGVKVPPWVVDLLFGLQQQPTLRQALLFIE